ncbi:hypothetical protein BE21_56825 [Sorangium cellulosum]|uniref:Uncharacterized protein n=1 Tax=Sorangium cellulosum TaxID=56 RepID=A0A150T8U4_SORCE|nr:hypothetical protein BE21_56825 [Sorangium cellulosum]
MHLKGDARRPALAVVVLQCERVLECSHAVAPLAHRLDVTAYLFGDRGVGQPLLGKQRDLRPHDDAVRKL